MPELVDSPKRHRILVGALEAVGDEGLEATSVRAILARSGLYRQAFYDEFADKQECFLAALDLGIAELEAAARLGADGAESWQERLRGGLGAVLAWLEAEPALGRAVLVEVHVAGPAALDKRAAALRRATEFIELARAEAADLAVAAIAAEGVVSGIHSIVYSRLSSRSTEGLTRLLPDLMYFAVLPYFGAAEAAAAMDAARVG